MFGRANDERSRLTGIASFTYLVEIPGQWTEQTGISLTGIAKGFRTLSFVFIYLFKWNVRIQFQRGICAWQIQMFYCDQICKVNLAFIHRHMSLEFLMGGLVHSFYKYRIIRTKLSVLFIKNDKVLSAYVRGGSNDDENALY